MTAFKVVLIGASKGGLKAVGAVLSELPADFSVPIVIVQHRQVESDERLVALLQKRGKLEVREPQDKDDLVAGTVYLAPTDYHLLVEPGRLTLSTEAPVCRARPSIDVLFESAASSYGSAALAVVLTGASEDGALGAASIAEAGGRVLVQRPTTAESPVMPEATIRAASTAEVLALEDVAARLVALCMNEGEGVS
jgi:two-component system chemotaxis response regulator CheB